MAVTETWLGSHKDAELRIEGYQLFRCDRNRRKKRKRGRLSGGVAAYVQDSLASHMEVKLQFSNGVVELLGLYSSLDNLFLAIVYRQPNDVAGGNFSTINELQPAIEKLQTALADIGEPTPNILVCGDFNLPNSVWDNNNNNNALSAGEYSIHDYLSNFMSSNFLNQYITKATHKDGNTLDLIFLIIAVFFILMTMLFQHYLLFLIILLLSASKY